MAHIRHTLSEHFTGHVGPVRFIDGHAECADADLLEFFRGQPDVYDVDPDPKPRTGRPQPNGDGEKPSEGENPDDPEA